MWIDTYIKNEKVVSGENLIKSTVKPKYTKEAVIRENGKERKGRGWTKEGINRFNQLFQLVVQDWRKKRSKGFL